MKERSDQLAIGAAFAFGLIQLLLSFYLTFEMDIWTQPVVGNLGEFSLFDGQRTLWMNPDEESNFVIAQNHIAGLGYSRKDPVTGVYELSAFHGTFTVFLYEALINSNIDFDVFVLSFFLLSALLHAFSLIAIHRLLYRYGARYAFAGLLLWALYPPSIWFIGPLFLYESVCTSLLILIFYVLEVCRRSGRVGAGSVLSLTILTLVGMCFRAHLIPILTLLYAAVVVFPAQAPRLQLAAVFGGIGLLGYLMHVPVLEKNRNDFGAAVISTQSGFVLWEGANPQARGSWDGSGRNVRDGLTDMPNVEESSQLEKSLYLKDKALAWMIANPIDYGILLVRKVAIYFLPQNYNVLPGHSFYNPFNAAVYIGFFAYLFGVLLGRIELSDGIVLVAPVAGSLLLSVVFFTGHRWRFYAEPFMLMAALVALRQLRWRVHYQRLT